MSDLDNNQNKQEKPKGQHGGAREGGGRPKGSTTRPKITDFMSEKEIKEYVILYLKMARKDPRMLTHLMEQLMGKATQGIEGNLDFNIAKILSDLDKE